MRLCFVHLLIHGSHIFLFPDHVLLHGYHIFLFALTACHHDRYCDGGYTTLAHSYFVETNDDFWLRQCELCEKYLCSGPYYNGLSADEQHDHSVVTASKEPMVCIHFKRPEEDTKCHHTVCHDCIYQKTLEAANAEGKGVAIHGRRRRFAAAPPSN